MRYTEFDYAPLDSLKRQAMESCERRGHRMMAMMRDNPIYMESLKGEAISSCSRRGHRMTGWNDYSESHSVCECQDCGMEVQVLTNPLPNQIDIGGEAVALNCGDEGGEDD